MDWSTVLSLAGLFAVGCGYLTRQMNCSNDDLSTRIDRLEDSLAKRIDQLTERYITHLEHHPR
jgi:hypothetical protein